MKIPEIIRLAAISLFLSVSLPVLVAAQPEDLKNWRPVSKEELALKSSTIDKEANAEILFADTYIEDEFRKIEFYRYMRIKVFNERGAQEQGSVEIPYDNKEQVTEISARTIKPDGEIVPFDPQEIRDRDLIKVGKRQRRMKSFAMPAVVPGAILEFRWRTVVKGSSLVAERALPLQFELPSQRIRYRYRPIKYMESALVFHGLQTDSAIDFIPDKNGIYSFEQLNKPAYHEEPLSLPERNVYSWCLINYQAVSATNRRTYWRRMGEVLSPYVEKYLKVNKEVREKAEEVVGDTREPRQKFARLVEFVRTSVRIGDEDRRSLTAQQAKDLEELRKPDDLLKQRYGTRENVAMLLVAMASAVGLDAQLAYLPNRREFLNAGGLLSDLILYVTVPGVVVTIDQKPVFYYPTSRKLPLGMVPAMQMGDEALVLEPGNARLVRVEETPPEQSRRVTKGELRLTADGALSGQVSHRFTGHAAEEFLDGLKNLTPAESEERVTEQIVAQLPGAKVTSLALKAGDDLTGEIGYSFEVAVPGYARKTGTRLFLQPALTRKGLKPLLESSVRYNDLQFNFPYQDSADIRIEIPKGYVVEAGEGPQPFAYPNYGLSYEATFSLLQGENSSYIQAKRDFTFNRIYLPRNYYDELKRMMDLIHLMDNQILSLRQQ